MDEKRIDPETGSALTFMQVFQLYGRHYNQNQIQHYWFYSMKPLPVEYRFDQGDRVLCNVGDRWLIGRVLSKDVEDPEDPSEPNIPYVVKTDAIPGEFESQTISAPADEDDVVRRERCFKVDKEWKFARFAAPIVEEKHRTPLTFQVGDLVAIRVEDRQGGYEQWARGCVDQVWARLPGSTGKGWLRTAAEVPYVVATERGMSYFCHRDEHTLIRRPENVPRVPCKSISKRFEERPLPDGGLEKFDHVTLRGKKIEQILDDSDSD